MTRSGLSWDVVSVPVGLLAAVVVVLFAPVDSATARLLAITAVCIALWIATPVPPAVTGMLCIGSIGVVFSPELALTGFQSPTLWLVVFGLLLGEAARQSGLSSWARERIETVAFPADTDTLSARQAFTRLLLVLNGAAVALAVLVPSALVRILMIAPVLVTLRQSFDDDGARIGIFLGPLLATFYAAPGVFTAGLPNLITTGIAESLGASTISWTRWTVQMFPLMGLGRAAIVTGVVYRFYRPASTETVSVSTAPAQMDASTRRMLAFMLFGAFVWTTETFHGLHPFFGALAVVVLALLPGLGVVSLDDLSEVDLSIVFFIGAVFAIGTGFGQTGFAEAAASELLTVLPTTAPLWLVLAVVYAATTALTFLLEGLAAASVLTPVLVSYAQQVGLPLDPILMIESVALGTYFFPYQTVVFVTILGQGITSARDLIRTAGVVSLLTIVTLLPIQIAIFATLY